jgi:hypothetical protein
VSSRQVALGAECHPFSGGSFAPAELDAMTDKDIFFKFFVEPVYRILLICGTELYCLELDLKSVYLGFKRRILLRRLDKALAEYRCRAVLINQLNQRVKDTHRSYLSSSANVTAVARVSRRHQPVVG